MVTAGLYPHCRFLLSLVFLSHSQTCFSGNHFNSVTEHYGRRYYNDKNSADLETILTRIRSCSEFLREIGTL